ncbi:MAG TPA: hypothetical protein PKK23_06780 [Nitrospirales bacterium]|nr:hypothetical protein [Nitrospirales bacterium]
MSICIFTTTHLLKEVSGNSKLIEKKVGASFEKQWLLFYEQFATFIE